MKETGVISKLISRTIAAAVVLAMGFAAGYIVRSFTATHNHAPAADDTNQPQIAQSETWWTCALLYGPDPGIG